MAFWERKYSKLCYILESFHIGFLNECLVSKQNQIKSSILLSDFYIYVIAAVFLFLKHNRL